MSELQKNGAPDLWWGGSLVELKRGRDRLSDDQRKWHRHYYIRHAAWPMVVYYDGRDDFFRVFDNYLEFDDWCAGKINREEQYLPELNYCLKNEYALLNKKGRGPAMTPVMIEEAQRMRADGRSYRDVAATMGIPKSTLMNNLRKGVACPLESTTAKSVVNTVLG
jgi:hypothetical protein